jgi:hypothetical protein
VFPSDVPAHPGALPSPSRSTDDELGFLFVEVVRHLPEFVPRYMELAEAGDDDPGAAAVLLELADFAAARLRAVEAERSALARALGLVEALLDSLAGDSIGTELVGYAFFDTFTVEDRRLLAANLGPRSLDLLESLEQVPSDPDW